MIWLSDDSRSEDKEKIPGKDFKKEEKDVKAVVADKAEKEDNKEVVEENAEKKEEQTQSKDADDITTENMDLDDKWRYLYILE